MTPRATRPPALVLVATPIGNLGDLPPRAVEELRDADVIAAEDTRRTRRLLSHASIPSGGRLVAVHEHNEAEMAQRVVEHVRAGRRVAFVTDAGMPSVSDPGERLVRACADAGLLVEVVPGPSAALGALVISGLPTDRFVFEGFLPAKGARRAERVESLAGESRTAVVFEAPHRLERTLRDLTTACGPERRVAIVRELTKRHEEVWRGTLGDTTSGPPVPTVGEVVIVLGPNEAVEEVGDAELERELERRLATGESARDAAAGVAADLGVPKRRVYDLAVRLRDEMS